MKAQWNRTDETENTIDYLQVATSFRYQDLPHRWKWLTISLHGALYGSTILAIKGTDPDRVLEGKKVISVWRALKRCQSDSYMLQNVGSQKLLLLGSEHSSINFLSNTFRNNFEHFAPGNWSIEVSGFPKIVTDICRIIRFLLLESGNVRLSSSQGKRIAGALRKLGKY
jgi:hypothetical protein